MKRSIRTLRRYSHLLSLSLALFVVGCLMCETTEYRITMNKDGKSGMIVTIMRNVQSGESEQAKQQKDFDQAIQSWKGDEYLLQRMDEGLYVKDRELTIEENVLVWKEKAIFSDLADIFKREITNDTLRFVFRGDQKIVATNGVVQSVKDSTVVFWALPAAKEIILKTKENNFTPSSDFVAEFKTYMKQSK